MVFPLFGMFINLLLNCHNCLGRTTSRVIFFKFIFFSEFFLFLFTFFLFLFHLRKFSFHFLFFSSQWDFNFIFFIEIFNSIRNFRELISFHELTDPQSSISQHFFLQWILPFLKKLIFESLQCFFVLLLIFDLNLSHFLSMFVHFKYSAVGIVRILRFFKNT